MQIESLEGSDNNMFAFLGEGGGGRGGESIKVFHFLMVICRLPGTRWWSKK